MDYRMQVLQVVGAVGGVMLLTVAAAVVFALVYDRFTRGRHA